MKISQNLIDFLNANPLDQVRYLLYFLKCRLLTLIYRTGFWLSLLLGHIKLDKAGFYVLVYSGALKNMFDVGLVDVEMLDKVLADSGYPSEWLGYGERLSSPWRHTFTRLAMFFRAR
jgi:hypothetical protein